MKPEMATRKRAPDGGRKRTIASESERLRVGELCEKKQLKKMWLRVHERLEETPQGARACTPVARAATVMRRVWLEK
jgi:hypothetical protein